MNSSSKFSRWLISYLKVFGILIGLGGAAGVHAQVTCTSSQVGLTWSYNAQPQTCGAATATLASGNYSSIYSLEAAAVTQTVASLNSQNPGCSASMYSSWVASGACAYSQVNWGGCGGSSLVYSLSTTGHVTSSQNIYLESKTQDMSCFSGSGLGGTPTNAPTKTDGGCTQCEMAPGDPVNASNGNVFITQSDYAPVVFGHLVYQRYYNSDPAVPAGRLGPGWRDTFDRTILLSSQIPTASGYTGTPMAFVYRPDGRIVTFYVTGTSATPTDPDTKSTLQVSYGTYTYYDEDNSIETYSTVGGPQGNHGELSYMRFKGGERLTMAYTSYPGIGDVLTKVKDDFGHSLTFTLNTAGTEVLTMTDTASNVFNYTYNGQGYLSGVYYPGPTPGSLTGAPYRQYTYTPIGSAYALNGITDENNNSYETWTYDTGTGRALSNYQGSSQNLYSFVYSGTGGTGTTQTDGAGVSSAYTFTILNGVPKYSSIITNGTLTQSGGYNAAGQLTSETDPKGNNTTHVYNTQNLETSRTEAVGTSNVRTIVTTWASTFRLPLTITTYPNSTGTGTASQAITYTYDGFGNVLTKTVANPATSVSEVWTNTYDTTNNNGHLLTADGPRTDVVDKTTYAYYSCTTGAQCGQINTITDALGRVTTVNTYTANGLPLTITDPNSLVTTLAYDNQNRVVSSTVGAEISSFTYTPTGQVLRATLPDGAYVQFSYDTAHRLTQVLDGLGNTKTFAYSPMGIRTTESEYDPLSNLNRTLTRSVDTYGRISAVYGAAGTSSVETSFLYDNNGNANTITEPLSRVSLQSFDPLNRLASSTNASSGVTQVTRDALDQVTSVIDPRSLTTTYSRNGLGELLSTVSPDTGTTTNTYDSGGNLKTTTDARSAVGTFAYDALNRVTSVAYTGSLPTQTIVYTYDSGSNAIGQLSGASDSNHTLAWTYNTLERVASKTQTISSVGRTASYVYTNGDLTQLTTPSGQVIAYTYNNHNVSAVSINGTSLLSAVTLEPFGAVHGWTWGNGATETRSHNTDGNPYQTGGPELVTYGYDNAFRLTGATNATNSALTWTYGYDAIDRITSATQPSTTLGWTYDANFNRLTQTGSPASTFNVASSSNEISSTTGALTRTYSYDTSGNTTGYTGVSFTYNNRGRLQTSTAGGITTTYLYDATGQRIQKSSSTGTTVFVYDENHHLIGEYTSAGVLLEETVWLNDLPVATIQPAGTSTATFYVHTDQLGAPHTITRPSDNAIVWRWDLDPYGVVIPNSNPGGLGVFSYNLRLPGQYADVETGLNYNGYRDYDPQSGRYLESDPIGLAAGTNPYAYVTDNPEASIDPDGLCKVEVRFKPAVLEFLPYYHGYIITTDLDGSQQVFRGGPEGIPRWNSPIYGYVHTVHGPYDENSKDWTTATRPSRVYLDDNKPCACTNQKMGTALDKIDALHVRYAPLGYNSNGVVETALNSLGLSSGKLPVFSAPRIGNVYPIH